MFELSTFSSLAVAAVPVSALITGLTQVVKSTFHLSARYIPLAAVLIGALLGTAMIQATGLGALVGVALGLGSVGLWEVGKTSIGGVSSESKERGL